MHGQNPGGVRGSARSGGCRGSHLPLAAGTAQAPNPECTTTPAGQPCTFHNVLDFRGQTFSHVSFDPPDERTPGDIVAKFPGLQSFSIEGGNAGIRHTSEHISTFGSSGLGGGPVSGEYRVDWGYFGTSSVTLVFATPVDAVGAFFGGDAGDVDGGDGVHVTFEDGTTFRATLSK